MRVVFLGTGTSQGVPVIACKCDVCTSLDEKDKRLRTSILICTPQTQVVIDTGPDFRQQMLKFNVNSLDAVVFTHEHKDHTAGLDDIRAYNAIVNQPMPIYAHQRVINSLKGEFPYIFHQTNYPGVPRIYTHEINLTPFQIGDINLIPVEVMHHKLPVLGFRVGNFTYITDANFISDLEIDKLKGTEILVVNGLQKESHLSHFTLAEALNFIKKINPKKAYLTHISHRLGKHKVVSEELPENVEIAYDGLELNF